MENFIKELFEQYDTDLWEKTAFFFESNGFLVTSRERIKKGLLNKNESAKYLKEREMCLRFACFGFRIEHLAEYPGLSSYDINIIHHPVVSGIAIVNGKRAELKSLKSANNILKRAKYAIFNQKAELIMFEFPSRNKAIENTLKTLSAKGLHGYYYYADENGYQSF